MGSHGHVGAIDGAVAKREKLYKERLPINDNNNNQLELYYNNNNYHCKQ